MIALKTLKELCLMREAGRIAAGALAEAGRAVEPGVSTAEIERTAKKYIEKRGAYPTFLNYGGFPSAICVSVNNEVIHGIPSKKRVIKEGDIVSIDLGATLEGFIGDNAATFAAGKLSPEAKRLSDTTKEALHIGLKAAVAGGRVGDIGFQISKFCKGKGYGVVREYVGHGVGKNLHEDPQVPNFGTAGRGTRLLPGMTIAVEPMINQGTGDIVDRVDGFTVVTRDGKLSAHFEHTIAITKDGYDILTMV
ncbi:MAG: type I methionyl aminopeptidase [Oscillospiraceae bacterium]|nr:type I methionyl aminopeptidase [Oscillospiraceae bacterium]